MTTQRASLPTLLSPVNRRERKVLTWECLPGAGEGGGVDGVADGSGGDCGVDGGIGGGVV